MSKADTARNSVHPPAHRNTGPTGPDAGTDTGEVLSLLGDEYTRTVLETLKTEGPLSAVDLVERLDASRATVYRRLDRLESSGILESTMRVDLDGHHRQQYRVTVDRARFQFGADGVSVQFTT